MQTEMLTESMTARGLSRKTISVYLVSLRKAELSIDLDKCTAQELRAYAESLPRTRWSRALLRSSLLAYWRATGRPDGPAEAIPVPSKPKMACKALEDAEAAALADAARRRGDLKGLAVLLGLYTGLRRSEIASLRWSDVDATGWVTVVGKGDVTRTFPLHDELRPTFEQAAAHRRPSRRGHDWIFRGRWAEPVHPTTIWLWVREVADDAGLGAVPTHVLRHTALATALDNCRDLRAVQMLAGHARPETTAGYTRVTRRRLVDAVTAIHYGEKTA
jgi:integrase